eukprot:2194429-Prymnesium_polylepis.1
MLRGWRRCWSARAASRARSIPRSPHVLLLCWSHHHRRVSPFTTDAMCAAGEWHVGGPRQLDARELW